MHVATFLSDRHMYTCRLKHLGTNLLHCDFPSPYLSHSSQTPGIAMGLEFAVRDTGRWVFTSRLLHQPWRKCHDSEGLRLPQYHREIILARMNRFNSNGSPVLFMHSQTLTSLKLHFFLGSLGGMSEAGCDMIMKVM